MRLLTADVLRGVVQETDRLPLLDERWMDALSAAPEVKLMRSLTPAYHVVSAEADGDLTRLTVRDLRTRNFGTRFGALELWLDAEGTPTRRVWRV